MLEPPRKRFRPPPPEQVDVLIVGAGLAGIGAACHLRRRCPGKSFAVLEGRDSTGGTWDLFRYPGIRSDSDMFTLGYSFKPWEQAEAIADGPSILAYIRETAREHDVEGDIHTGCHVVDAEWSSELGRWSVAVERGGESLEISCAFLFGCTGYYRYDEGHSPAFEGIERFAGRVVHPQHWPDDLDYAGRRVVVIGSGATAVTLVPAMAAEAEHVTMLQRSPSYVVSLPARDPVADLIRNRLPPRFAYPIVRWKNVLTTQLFFAISRRAPRLVKRLLRLLVARQLDGTHPLDPHFDPTYDPWDQRVCLVPDGDLFAALNNGSASIVTDSFETFTERGVRTASGVEIDADVAITATGLNLLPMGGIELTVDGERIELGETVGYKGMMLSGVPNFAMTIGYTNASWTLKSDLVAQHVCRLLQHMEARGYATCTPTPPPAGEPTEPFIDLQAGYVQRAAHLMPRQGARPPWRLHQNYPRDVRLLRYGPVDGEAIEFARAPTEERRRQLALVSP